jgi:hypothetical protein
MAYAWTCVVVCKALSGGHTVAYPCFPLVCGLWGGEVSPLGERGEGVWLSEGLGVIQLC